MNLRNVYTIFFCLLITTLLFLLTSYSDGPAIEVGMGFTGAPGESGSVCSNCHNLLGSYGIVQVDLVSNIGTLPYEYLPGAPTLMDVTINTTSGSPLAYGFQLIMMDDVGNPMDVTYSSISSNAKEVTLANGRKYIEHDGPSTSNTFSFIYELNTFPPGYRFRLLLFTLPVELSDFTATTIRNDIQLNWTTETEDNNDYFAVEHSTNGSDFIILKTINGAGTASERHSYTYTHDAPTNGNNYYRLCMVDMDGKETYSDILVEKMTHTLSEATVFPQPTTEHAKVYINSAIEEPGELKVYDLSGKLIYCDDIQLVKGTNHINVNCSKWIPAHYVVSIVGEELGVQVVRLVKK